MAGGKKTEFDRYLVACTRLAPAKNIYLIEATYPGGSEPPSVTGLKLINPPKGTVVLRTCLMHLTEHSRKFDHIFKLPRGQWITLPDVPELGAEQEEAILGEVLLELRFGQTVADFSARGEIVEIVPRNPEFTCSWMRNWLTMAEDAQTLYGKRRKEQMQSKDPYRDLR